MNPLLPLDCFVPDGEAHVMPDGCLYVYGSWDRRDVADYCSDRYHVFSTDNMIDWVDHGESYRAEDGMLYAPDCAYKDGKYYLYACTANGGEETAVSDTPYGPFSDTRPLEFADGRGIDPSVFVDDDGIAYYFWGQFSLMGARLNPDMRSIDMSSVTNNILTEEEHGFHEGSSIRKIRGKYYLVYTDITRGRATCLSYATSEKPLGPYTRRGVIIDNIYCDPATWNNHGSIEEFNGQLYVFYHRSTRGNGFNRRLCAEKLEMLDDGSIKEAEMTSSGPEDSVDAFAWIEASRACRLRCGGCIRTDEDSDRPGGEYLSGCMGSASWNGFVEFKYLSFAEGACGVEIEARGNGIIRVRQRDRNIEAVVTVHSDDQYGIFSAEAAFRGGILPARLFIESDGMDIRRIRFIR